MPRRHPAIILKVCFLMVFMIFVQITGILGQILPKQVQAADMATWTLTDGVVTDPGKSSETPEGLLITGYTVQARAQALGWAPIEQGKFTIHLTIFTPRKNMPGQEVGKYYVRGAWDLTKKGAVITTRHTPDSLKGFLKTVLPFNPAAGPGSFEADVYVGPMMRRAGKRSRGVGKFLGNEKFAGEISVPR